MQGFLIFLDSGLDLVIQTFLLKNSGDGDDGNNDAYEGGDVSSANEGNDIDHSHNSVKQRLCELAWSLSKYGESFCYYFC